jgi:hypothetical protein
MSFYKSTILFEDRISMDGVETKICMVGYVREGHNVLLSPPCVVPFNKPQYLLFSLPLSWSARRGLLSYVCK